MIARIKAALKAVIWDTEVQRGAKGVAVLVAIRFAIAVGASPTVLALIRAVAGVVGA